MKKLLITLILLTVTLSVKSQTPPLLSDSAIASVITCGPGNDFYLAFGHSAIRIQDSASGIDYVYNYGTFDFDTPHFYWKFAQGKLNYCLSRTRMENFMAVYEYERRWVCEQRLNLTPQEVKNLYVMLEWNHLPANRYYKYDFFRDNCATRVRDMVEGALGHTTPRYCEEEAGHSYRHYVHSSTKGGCLQWWTLGVDLLLGLPADHRCDAREMMFHPVKMMHSLEYSQLDSDNDSGGDMVQHAVQHRQDHREPLRHSFPPLVVFSLLLMAVALLSWRKLWPRWADRLLFCITGLVGLFLCFMWFGTDHWCTRWNLNILWTSPLMLLIAIRLNSSPRWALWLQLACFAVSIVWVIACGLSVSIIPIIIMLALRMVSLLQRPLRLKES